MLITETTPVLAAIAQAGNETGLYALWAVNLVAVLAGTFAFVRRGGDAGYLDDAARIDGCGFLGRYWHVALPLARPALAAAWVLIALAAMDDLLAPVIENGGVVTPGLYALHASAHGLVLGAGAGGIGAALILLVVPLVAALGRRGKL